MTSQRLFNRGAGIAGDQDLSPAEVVEEKLLKLLKT